MFEDGFHTMQPLGVGADGVQEWFCPDCGRHVTLYWHPDYRLTVVYPGDEHVSHISANAPFAPLGLASLEAELVEWQPGLESDAAELPASGATAGAVRQSDTPIDFGDPERTDGLAPWIALLERLSQDDKA